MLVESIDGYFLEENIFQFFPKVSMDFFPLKVHDIMSTEEIKIYENDLVKNAKKIMNWEGLKHVCVFSEDNELVGTLHYDDIHFQRNKDKKVMDIMHRDYHKIYGELDAEIGKRAVLLEKDHCLPVFENKEIVGILNLEDIL
ncbi:MAG: hypothetical protein CL678_02900 [Bdellovibrionaceae bacterium]|nr:hypothetical protein [Pseudobdellovibrionaceae bacterium]|tara:strand:+ start:1083 stop:1508 length:426 start_codon:yes stop_codon:yes gene_type:complete